MPAVYTERLGLSKRIGGYLNWCFSALLITNAMVAANATITLLKVAITANAVYTEQKPMAMMLNLALDKGLALGLFSETHGVTTVAGLVALTDSGTTMKQGFFG